MVYAQRNVWCSRLSCSGLHIVLSPTCLQLCPFPQNALWKLSVLSEQSYSQQACIITMYFDDEVRNTSAELTSSINYFNDLITAQTWSDSTLPLSREPSKTSELYQWPSQKNYYFNHSDVLHISLNHLIPAFHSNFGYLCSQILYANPAFY